MIQSRVVSTFAGAALSVLVLAGCQGGDPDATSSSDSASASASAPASSSASPSAPASPTPSPASEAGPAVNIPVPEKPALADENSIEGLEAFTGWWFELLNYAQATNNFEPLWAVTDDGCKTCHVIAGTTEDTYANGGWQIGGQVRLESYETKFRQTASGSVDSYITIEQDELSVLNRNGDVEETMPAVGEPVLRRTIAVYETGAWLMLDFGTVDVSS
ncbi:DUF6318 family protein [Arthrobacter tecti]